MSKFVDVVKNLAARGIASTAKAAINNLDFLPRDTLSSWLRRESLTDSPASGAYGLLAEQIEGPQGDRVKGPELQEALKAVGRKLRSGLTGLASNTDGDPASINEALANFEPLLSRQAQILDETLREIDTMTPKRYLSILGVPNYFQEIQLGLTSLEAETSISPSERVKRLLELMMLAADLIERLPDRSTTLDRFQREALRLKTHQVSERMKETATTMRELREKFELLNRLSAIVNPEENIAARIEMLEIERGLIDTLPRRMRREVHKARLEGSLLADDTCKTLVKGIVSFSTDITEFCIDTGMEENQLVRLCADKRDRSLPIFHMNQLYSSGPMCVLVSHRGANIEVALATPFGRFDCYQGSYSQGFTALVEALRSKLDLIVCPNGPKEALPFFENSVCLKRRTDPGNPIERKPEETIASEILRPLWKKAIKQR